MKKNISAVRGFVHSAPALVVDSTGQAEPALRPMDDREVVRWVLENGEKADDGILANKTKEQKFLVSAGVEAQRRIESAEEAERARQATEAAEKPPRKPAAKIGATAKPDRTAVEKTVAEKATKAAALVADFKNFLKKGEPNDAEVVLTELRQATIQAGLLRVLKGSIARRVRCCPHGQDRPRTGQGQGTEARAGRAEAVPEGDWQGPFVSNEAYATHLRMKLRWVRLTGTPVDRSVPKRFF